MSNHKITIICGNCEYEWDGNTISADSNCLKCNCPSTEHVVRED